MKLLSFLGSCRLWSGGWIILLVLLAKVTRGRSALTVSSENISMGTVSADFGRSWPQQEALRASISIPSSSESVSDPSLCAVTLSVIDNDDDSVGDGSKALLVNRPQGSNACSFLQQALNVQLAYPDVDYLVVQNNENRAMVRAKKGSKIGSADSRLGIVMISYEDGNRLREALSMATSGSLKIEIEGYHFNTVFSDKSAKATVILSKLFGFASALGSFFVLWNLLGSRQARQKHLKVTFNRLLLGLSVCDTISSLAIFVSTWAIPKTPPEGTVFGDLEDLYWDERYPWATGNTRTCDAQGFFVQLGVAGSVFFLGCISIQYLLIVQYGWSESSMQKLERFVFFPVCIVFSIATAATATSLGLMNPLSVGFCWIERLPTWCYYKDDADGPVGDWCEKYSRGKGDWYYRLFFGLIWIGLVFLLVIYTMMVLFCIVRRQESRMKRWSSNAREGRAQRKVIRKALLYIGTYLVVYVPTALAMFMDYLGGMENILVAVFFSSQGILNAMIYSGKIQAFCMGCRCGSSQKTESTTSSATATTVTGSMVATSHPGRHIEPNEEIMDNGESGKTVLHDESEDSAS